MSITKYSEGTKLNCHWTIYNANCIELLYTQIAKDSIDCIITSPPYLNKRAYSKKGMNQGNLGKYFYSVNGHAMPKEIGCNQSSREYFQIITTLFKLCYRALKNERFMAINVNKLRDKKKTIDVSSYFIKAAENAGFSLRDIIIWIKKNTRTVPPNSLQYYLDDGWEYILLFSKGTAKLYRDNVVQTDIIYCNNCGQEITNIQNIKPNYIKTNIGFTEKSNLQSPHPAKFPTEIPNFIFHLCTQENATILDPFAGIGSSLIAGISNSLDVIGCELNTNFCKSILYEINKLGHQPMV